MNKGRAADVVCLDTCKASDTVLHHILTSKLERDGCEGWRGWWMAHPWGQSSLGWMGPGQPDLVVGSPAHDWVVCRWIIFKISSNQSHSVIF